MTRFLSRALMVRVSRNQLKRLAERRLGLEVSLGPAQDHPLATDVLEDVQDPREVVQRVAAPGGHDVHVGRHDAALGQVRQLLGGELHPLQDLAVLEDVGHALAHDRDLAELEGVDDELRQARVELRLRDDARERVPVLQARPHAR